jgi:hypothetical protein
MSEIGRISITPLLFSLFLFYVVPKYLRLVYNLGKEIRIDEDGFIHLI